MVKFHRKKFEKQIVRTLGSKTMKKRAYNSVRQKVNNARTELLKNFEQDPITKEIESGPSGKNISGTLGGYGNLFTFIGFPRGTNPIRPIRNYLKGVVHIFKEPRMIRRSKSVEFRFKVDTPRLGIIENLTPSPWEGKSWTKGIERGISGLGNYMYNRTESFPESRSGKALQKTEQLRGMAFRPVAYMTKILERFYKKLK